jgi:hypothetical protein
MGAMIATNRTGRHLSRWDKEYQDRPDLSTAKPPFSHFFMGFADYRG